MSLPMKPKPETHYGSFIIVLGVVVSLILGIFALTSFQSSYNAIELDETNLIKNMNCNQLWDEENARYLGYSMFNDRFNIVRTAYHNQCVSQTFGVPEPSTDQQDAYFLSLDCKALQAYNLKQNIYFERGLIDYKEMCRQ
jgi:hypothetical protein